MLWVEGKSGAWCYVSEMELKVPVPENMPLLKKSETATINGEDEIEIKAEELRKRALSYVPKRSTTPEIGLSPATSYYPTSRQETDAVHFVDHRKERRPIVQELVMSAGVIIAFGAVVMTSRFYFRKDEPANAVATKIVTTDNHAATATVIHPTETSLPEETNPLKTAVFPSDSLMVNHPAPEKPRNQPFKTTKKLIPVTQDKSELQPINEEIVIPPSVAPEQDLTPKETPSINEVAVPAEKKKTVGQAIRGLFKKKKKNQDTGADLELKPEVNQNH